MINDPLKASFFRHLWSEQSNFFREVECTELFCTDPVNHLWGQSFIDHWTYSWAHASIGDGHRHDTIFLSVQEKKHKTGNTKYGGSLILGHESFQRRRSSVPLLQQDKRVTALHRDGVTAPSLQRWSRKPLWELASHEYEVRQWAFQRGRKLRILWINRVNPDLNLPCQLGPQDVEGFLCGSLERKHRRAHRPWRLSKDLRWERHVAPLFLQLGKKFEYRGTTGSAL